MILSTKYLDNLRPFTKHVKNDKVKQWKKFEEMSEKSFSVWFKQNRIISSRTSTSLLQILENFNFFGVRSQVPVYV